jgi:sodium-dependent dicarboxylate transporter 2/3/5
METGVIESAPRAPAVASDEPEGPARPRRRWPVVLAAVGAATAMFLVGPEPWPEGRGTVRLWYRNVLVVDAVADVGSTEIFTGEGDALGTAIAVAFPDGLPVNATIEGRISAIRDGDPVTLALEDLELTLVLPDGREELLPLVSADGSDVLAERRPPVHARAVLALLGIVVVLWVSEVIPLWATSLLVPVVLVVAGVGDATASLAPFFDPIIALFLGGFLMAEAMRRVGLDHLAAISIVARAGRSPLWLYAALLAVAAFLSMWMSNTAAVAVLIPIGMALTEPLGSPGYRRAVILGIAYAATIGGVGSAIGTPANPLAIEFLDQFAGRQISFVEWFAFGLPMVAIFLPIMAGFLWWRMRASVDQTRFRDARRVAKDELTRAGRVTRDQAVVLGVFTLVLLGWLTQTWHGVHTGIVALAGAVALAVLGKILAGDLNHVSWQALVTFGGGLTLGVFLLETGASDWIATRLTGLASLPAIVGVLAVAGLTLAVTTVASNTASAAMLIPLAIPLSAVLGVDPVGLVIIVAIASSIDFALVIGTPPTMLAHSTKLFTAGDIFRRGAVLDVVGLLLLVFVVQLIWQALGIV